MINYESHDDRDDTAREHKEMSRGAQTTWIVGAISAVGLGLIVLVGFQDAGAPERDEEIALEVKPDAGRADVFAASTGTTRPAAAAAEEAVDEAVLAAEQHVNRLEGEYEAALDDVRFGGTVGSYQTDPEIVAGQRRVTEMMELACRKYGTSCEEAELMRRQLNEMQSGF
jgi:cell division septation protein DedD